MYRKIFTQDKEKERQQLNHIICDCEVPKEHANTQQFLKTENKEKLQWKIISLMFSQDVKILANIVEFIYNINEIRIKMIFFGLVVLNNYKHQLITAFTRHN